MKTPDLGKSAAQEQRVPASRWAALAALFLVYLFNFVDRQILSILANDIKADLAIDDAQLGFLYGTAFAIFYAVFGIPLGWLADRTHRLRLLSAGLALWSVMTMLSGLAKNFAHLTIARIGVGVGEAAANPCAYSLIGDWFPPRLHATALSIYSAGLFVGSGLSLVLGGLIVESWQSAFQAAPPLGLAGWQVAFLAVGAPGIVLAIVLLNMREPPRANTQADGVPLGRSFALQLADIVPPLTLISAIGRGPRYLASHLIGAALIGLIASLLILLLDSKLQFTLLAIGYYAVFSWASALRHSDHRAFAATWGHGTFMAIVLAYSAISFVGYTSVFWAAPFAERSFDLSKTELSVMIGAANALGGFLGVILGGMASDRLAKISEVSRLIVPLCALLLPVPLILLGYSSGDVAVFVACNCLTQMATASALGACAASTQALVAPNLRGVATAIFLLGPTMIGLAFGPFMAGHVSEVSGSLAMGVQASLIAVVPGLAALLFAVLSFRRSQSR